MTTPSATGAITEADRNFIEEWQKVVPEQYDIIRLDVRGEEQHFLVGPVNFKFKLSTFERIITQDKILLETDDPFLNGAFRPITVPESVNITTNPNARSDEEILDILAASELAWEEWLKTIDSPATLLRMMELAERADVSLRRYKQLEGRREQVAPPTRVWTTDPELQKFLSDDKRDRTRGQGGRSSQYRENQ